MRHYVLMGYPKLVQGTCEQFGYSDALATEDGFPEARVWWDNTKSSQTVYYEYNPSDDAQTAQTKWLTAFQKSHPRTQASMAWLGGGNAACGAVQDRSSLSPIPAGSDTTDTANDNWLIGTQDYLPGRHLSVYDAQRVAVSNICFEGEISYIENCPMKSDPFVSHSPDAPSCFAA